MTDIKRKKGKVIANFDYHSKHTDLKVPIRLVKGRDLRGHDTMGSSICGDDFYFLVDIDKPEIYIFDSDVKKCEQNARKKLNEVCTVDWKNQIVVTFQLSQTHYNNNDSEMHRSFEMRYYFVLTGVNSAGKDVWMELSDDRRELHASYVRTGKPDGFSDEDHHKHTTTLIDDTPENVLKLKAILNGLDQLGSRLGDLLRPEKILHTLANVKLLGLPYQEKKADEA